MKKWGVGIVITKELKGKEKLYDDLGKEVGLFYYLVHDNDFYRIQVVKDAGDYSSSETTYPIAKSKEYVTTLLEIIQRNKVTPICLLEIMDDLLN